MKTFYKFTKTLLLSLLFMTIFTGCFTSFEPDIESKPVLCMNSLISEGDSLRVSLTRTWRWSEGSVVSGNGDTPIDLFVSDGTVKLYVNDEYKETLKLVVAYGYNPDDFYRPPYAGYDPDRGRKEYIAEYIPKSGDVIRLEAESSEYSSAWAEVEVPHAVPIDKVEYKVADFSETHYEDGNEIGYFFDLNAEVWFSDPGNSVEYYMYSTSTSGHRNTDGSWDYIYFDDVSDDPLFSEHVSALESAVGLYSGYTFFSDRQISGKSYPLHIDINRVQCYIRSSDGHPEIGDMSICMSLYTISPSYYKHVISVWQANDGIIGSLGSVGLADPVFESSNVSTGAGVVAARAKSTYSLSIADIIENNKILN